MKKNCAKNNTFVTFFDVSILKGSGVERDLSLDNNILSINNFDWKKLIDYDWSL